MKYAVRRRHDEMVHENRKKKVSNLSSTSPFFDVEKNRIVDKNHKSKKWKRISNKKIRKTPVISGGSFKKVYDKSYAAKRVV